ncbi:MAG: Mrp/NBP35 family ATP-binding protein [Planctomycetota bacterium]|nr:Mrp/NBP35 family ATP-binding protein [Planctomycetota bacterium]
MQPGGLPKLSLPHMKNIVAVASGKGGVGKSTVSSNLALVLSGMGFKVGLLDADIYGPSIPLMMGVQGQVDQATTPLPLERYGIKLMSMGFLVPPEKAVIWRGPMVHRALTQFLSDMNWGDLDYMVVDLPPGTGDAQLTLTQSVPLTAAVVVTTPQEVSLIDARKGLEMFREVRVPVLGIIENMSYFAGDDGKRYEIFGHGGGQKLAKATGIPFLGAIPIDPLVVQAGDNGKPMVLSHPESATAAAFRDLAGVVVKSLAQSPSEAPLPGLS